MKLTYLTDEEMRAFRQLDIKEHEEILKKVKAFFAENNEIQASKESTVIRGLVGIHYLKAADKVSSGESMWTTREGAAADVSYS